MEHTVIHDEKVNRFEVFESGQIAYLQYEEKDGVLDIRLSRNLVGIRI